MRPLPILAVALCAAGFAFAQAGAPAAVPTIDVKALDRTVDPCVDFYQFACGSWMANNPIPGDKTRWGRFDQLAERNLDVLRGILEEAAAAGPKADPRTRKVGDFYAACMDEKAVEAAGAAPLKEEFGRIAAVKDRASLVAEIARLHRTGVRGALFGFSASADLHDARVQIADLSDGGITLPDRDYYLKDDPKSKDTRAKYVAHVQKMFELAGDAPEAAAAEAQAVMAFETALAKANMDRTARRDPRNIDHRMTVAELQKLAPRFGYRAFFAAVGAPKFDSLNVSNPDFVKTVDGMLETTKLDDWKTYLRWKYLRSAAGLLSSPFVAENFAFWEKYLRGQKEPEARWKRCVHATDGALGEALGPLYVAKAFPADAKARTLALVQGVEKAMGADLKSLAWMSDATKAKGAAKLAAVTNKIGYPDKWRDYSKLSIARNDFVGNARRSAEFETHRHLGKIGQPVDKTEFHMTPPTVNAYYSSSENNINFPAGILQLPFYDAARDDAANYGGIGAVIGHELTHGFDDQGAKFDGDGNLSNWWSEADKAEFEKRTNCLAEEYEGFSPIEGVHLKGKMTLGENTADNGGVLLAFLALQEARKADPSRVPATIEGFTPEQRFFLGYAQVWCQNVTPEASRVLAMTDVHSPGRFRVNGVVSNSDFFRQAFSCKAGQPMVRENACRVW